MKESLYPGPRPLSTEDSRLLVGRDRDIDSIEFALNSQTSRALILHAASGVGKSSLLQAGVVPKLRAANKVVCSFSNWAELNQNTAEESVMSVLSGALRSAAASGLYEGGLLGKLLEAEETVGMYEMGKDPEFDYPNGIDPMQDLTMALSYLKDEFGDALVIVLDQLEELFRLDRPNGQRFVGILGRLLTPQWSEYSALKVVLSLRSEHIAELSPFERILPKEVWSRQALQAITRMDQIGDVIRPEPSDETEEAWVFSEDVRDRMRRYWMLAAFDQDAPPHAHAVPRDGFGLLHLHAALKVLWESAHGVIQSTGYQGQDLSSMSSDDLAELLRTSGGPHAVLLLSESDEEAGHQRTAERAYAGDGEKGGIWRWVFGEVLEEYLELWIREAMAELTGPSGPEIARETRAQAALMAPRLSSGSYKVVIDSDELAQSSGSDVLPDGVDPYFNFCVQFARVHADWFDTGPELEHKDAGVLAELLAEGDAQLALEAFLRDELGSSERARLESLLESPDRKSSAGRIRGEFMTLRETIHEVVVTHERALKWLSRASVVRFAPGPKDPRGKPTRYVSIVHDGFGPALRRWGVDATRTIEAVTSRLVATSGERPLFAGRAPEAICGTASDPLIWRDLVWIGCAVTRTLRDVTFEDCDLSGTVFLGCEFQNVTFHNCRMSGTTFINCTATGTLRLSATKSVEDGVVAAAKRALGAGAESFVADLRSERQVSSLIFRGGHIDRLVLEELWGAQLSVTEVSCGSWLIDYCKLEQVMMQFNATADKPAVRGEIRDSDLADLTLGNTLLQEKSDRALVSNARMEIVLAVETSRPDIDPGNRIRHLTLAISDDASEGPDLVVFHVGDDPQPVDWGKDRRFEKRHQDIRFVSKRALSFESTTRPPRP